MKNIILLLCAFHLLTVISCSGQKHPVSEAPQEVVIGDTVLSMGKNIGSILQHSGGDYWYASNGGGVYRYNGKIWMNITQDHGLCSNFVLKVEEDIDGKVWFTTRDGVCSFDGKTFTNHTAAITGAPTGRWQYVKGGLFFGHLNGICFYDGTTFTNFTIHPGMYVPDRSSLNRPYAIYSTLVDRSGNVWFGTQERGVCRYDGMRFTWFTENGLDKAAVRTLYQDKSGTVWASNNGAGLFRFNGQSFANITVENGLGNPEFLKSQKSNPGTLARPWTMNEDTAGNLWVGTIDNGLWKYNGTTLVNYTTANGLPGNSVWTLHKNRNGELWVVTDGEVVSEAGEFEKK